MIDIAAGNREGVGCEEARVLSPLGECEGAVPIPRNFFSRHFQQTWYYIFVHS